ncbi:MAG: DUF302 domain-containing protein [Rhodospirillales bacterium]|nr:DUF302 domain-containing protein [Rhodospirillales bacterium]
MEQEQLTVALKTNFGSAVALAVETFRAHGFSVAPPLDLQNAFRERLGVSFRSYVLLRLHHEDLALKALAMSAQAGAVCTCSASVQGMEDGMVEVTALDPLSGLLSASLIEEADVSLIAAEMQEKIVAAIQALARAGKARGVETKIVSAARGPA